MTGGSGGGASGSACEGSSLMDRCTLLLRGRSLVATTSLFSLTACSGGILDLVME